MGRADMRDASTAKIEGKPEACRKCNDPA